MIIFYEILQKLAQICFYKENEMTNTQHFPIADPLSGDVTLATAKWVTNLCALLSFFLTLAVLLANIQFWILRFFSLKLFCFSFLLWSELLIVCKLPLTWLLLFIIVSCQIFDLIIVCIFCVLLQSLADLISLSAILDNFKECLHVLRKLPESNVRTYNIIFLFLCLFCYFFNK